MFMPPGDPLSMTALRTALDVLPLVVYQGPVAGPGSAQVRVYDCPVHESDDRPYLRNVLFVVTLDEGEPAEPIPAHDCDGDQHAGRPAEPIIAHSHVSAVAALGEAAETLTHMAGGTSA